VSKVGKTKLRNYFSSSGIKNNVALRQSRCFWWSLFLCGYNCLYTIFW